MPGSLRAILLLCACFPAVAGDIYLVPFSHLDLFWAGTQEECLSRGNRIIARAMDLATRHPEFRFLLEDEVFVANYVETHEGSPELEQLKRLVKEGRIEISPKWAAIHQNTPRGEALVHNLLYGKRYAREVFGVDPLVANLGDLPSYTSQFPQILARSNVPYVAMTRMGPAATSLFYWKAPDGSKALTWNTLKGYGWGTFLTSKTMTAAEKRTKFLKDLADLRPTTRGPIMMNWGTDLWAPPSNLVETISAFNQSSPERLVFSSATEFFRRAVKTPDIPVISGEIPYAWWNILTSIVHMWPKAMSATDTLIEAEKFAAISHALGYSKYPRQELEFLWKKALESLDHNNYGQGGDIGDARKVEYADMVATRAGQIVREMQRNIAERVRSPFPRGMPVVIFNPLSWRRDDVVKVHVSLYGDSAPRDGLDDYRKALRVVDEAGTSVPYFVERTGSTVSLSLELVFVARGVPSLGYKTYFLVPAAKPDVFPNVSAVRYDDRQQRALGADQFESEYYRVDVDRATGRISIFDKELKRVVAKDMEMAAAEERAGNTLSIEVPTGRILHNSIRAVQMEENNPVRTVVRIDGSIGGVPVSQKLFLYQGLKRVDLENVVDWRPGRLMKLEQIFRYDHPDAKIQYGIPFGAIAGTDIMPNSQPRQRDELTREAWRQWRQIQDWIFAGTAEWGLTIAADHQVMTLEDGAIRAGMLRGTYQAARLTRQWKPFLLHVPPAGRYVFRYSLTSGKGDWRTAKSYRTGMAFNAPLSFFSPADDLSRKSLPPSQSFCSLEPANLVVSDLKDAESGPGVILRVFEIEGAPARTPLDFLGGTQAFQQVNLLEEPIPSSEQRILQMRPYEIRTLKLPAR